MMQISLPLLFALAAVFAPSFAAPTRTRCRCTAITGTNNLVSASQISLTSDPCANLGPSLEDFRHSEPDVFDSLISGGKPRATPTTEDLQPLTTHVLLELAARNGFATIEEESPVRPTERPISRIVCRSEPEPVAEFKDSIATLFALQVIVAMAVLACIAECLSLCIDLIRKRNEQPQQPLHLGGDEQRLMAYAPSMPLFSPGCDKKMQAYSACPSISSSAEKPCVCMAYATLTEEDEDDEINRPVM